MPARSWSFLFSHPPLSSSAKSQPATRSRKQQPRGIRIFPSLLLLFSQPVKTITLCLVSKLRYHYIAFPLGWISLISRHILTGFLFVEHFCSCIAACSMLYSLMLLAENERRFEQFRTTKLTIKLEPIILPQLFLFLNIFYTACLLPPKGESRRT